MIIGDVLNFLESKASLSLQESYDNAGLLTGDRNWDCRKILVALDVTEQVIEEAIELKCNLIVAHHPVIFSGLKKINGKNFVERTIISAIKNDIAIYAIHTNLDNVMDGVNTQIANQIGLENLSILSPKQDTLQKLVTYVPEDHAENVKQALFDAGAGHISNYTECSFSSKGEGTYKPGENSTPFRGEHGLRHTEPESRIEVVFPAWLQAGLIAAMKKAHPYEEVAYDCIALSNPHPGVGAGLVGTLNSPLPVVEFLALLANRFKVPVVRHTVTNGGLIKKVAVCGGAGSFLISRALAAGADAYVTADIKYHEFFNAENTMLLADIGHYESEQFTIDLLQAVLAEKFPTFAVLKTTVNTNPVRYFQFPH